MLDTLILILTELDTFNHSTGYKNTFMIIEILVFFTILAVLLKYIFVTLPKKIFGRNPDKEASYLDKDKNNQQEIKRDLTETKRDLKAKYKEKIAKENELQTKNLKKQREIDQKIYDKMSSFFQKVNHQISNNEWVKETDITKGTKFKDKKEIYLRYKKEGKQDWDKDIDPKLFEEWCDSYIEECYIIKKERDVAALERAKIQDKEKLYKTLTDISGVSDKVARTLMDQFPTLETIKNGSIEDLSDIPGVGKSIAKAIKARIG